MITTYQLELSARLMPSDGYKLYAWLLTQIPSAAAEALHSQQDHPISQFVTFDKEKDTSIWNIQLLSTEASALFAPAIESIETISLHTGEISVVSKLPKQRFNLKTSSDRHARLPPRARKFSFGAPLRSSKTDAM